ncbi:7922718d-0402-41f7-a86e-2612013717c7 [Sclerotinia trifoliorum]|uniref:7922718d-0402-41f7-a86e-2612013717c7 n=1 Tax=Sclerotinia trifoliorum TaxID=28548 RepID=A0A8H2W3I2_9HELO|nr:7922718d-0402-41f7-a86e-2612013717c7 [Sclerotinia trifoliorum]
MAFAVDISQIVLSASIVSVSYLLWVYFNSPLRNVPGPFLAKFTNIWRLLDVYGGRAELTHQLLHKKYGEAVRIGPNTVSLSNPKLIPTLYNLKGDFPKTDFYSVSDVKVGKNIMQNVFSVKSNKGHAQILKPIQKFYNMGGVMTLEGRIDDAITAFVKRVDELFVDGSNAGTVCKMDDWMGYFAWDVIAQLTFSKPMGFVENASDHSGFIRISERSMDYFGVIGQIPALDHWLGKNPMGPIGPPTFREAGMWCAEQSKARQEGTDGKTTDQKDMLDSFLEVKRNNPELMNESDVVGSLLINILAGADTTAIVLRSIIYYTLKTPRVYKKLVEELDSANLSTPVVYKEAIKLPYLEAVIKEASRVHPGVGLLLERTVPARGLALPDGTFLPAGTTVGINPWIAGHSKMVYGEDATSFVPERWLRYTDLETEEEYQTRLSMMKQTDLTFGAGNRICLGKNISSLNINKLIATLFTRYDMQLVDPKKEWGIQNSWFVRQTDIEVTIKRRQSRST